MAQLTQRQAECNNLCMQVTAAAAAARARPPAPAGPGGAPPSPPVANPLQASPPQPPAVRDAAPALPPTPPPPVPLGTQQGPPAALPSPPLGEVPIGTQAARPRPSPPPALPHGPDDEAAGAGTATPVFAPLGSALNPDAHEVVAVHDDGLQYVDEEPEDNKEWNQGFATPSSSSYGEWPAWICQAGLYGVSGKTCRMPWNPHILAPAATPPVLDPLQPMLPSPPGPASVTFRWLFQRVLRKGLCQREIGVEQGKKGKWEKEELEGRCKWVWKTPGGDIIDPPGFFPLSAVMKGRPFVTKVESDKRSREGGKKEETKGVSSDDLHALFLLAEAAGLGTVKASASSSRTLGFAPDWRAIITGRWYDPGREAEYGGKGPSGACMSLPELRAMGWPHRMAPAPRLQPQPQLLPWGGGSQAPGDSSGAPPAGQGRPPRRAPSGSLLLPGGEVVGPDDPLPAPRTDPRTAAQQYLDHQRVVLQSSSGLDVQVCCILCSLHSCNVLLPSTPSL